MRWQILTGRNVTVEIQIDKSIREYSEGNGQTERRKE
jgi:hypothetical protein